LKPPNSQSKPEARVEIGTPGEPVGQAAAWEAEGKNKPPQIIKLAKSCDLNVDMMEINDLQKAGMRE
jgi:hypothetical protein